MASGPSKMPLRYFGGKWRIAPWIIGHFPKHNCYVEPYAGGASVLIRKDEARAEVLNDVDHQVVNFWTILRTRTREFIQAVDLTPFSRSECRLAHEPTTDNLESARRFYIRAWQMRGGPRAQWLTGWRHCRGLGRYHTASHDFAKVEHLWGVAERLKRVQIENDLAERVITRYDTKDTLFYVDPPYVAATRSKWRHKAYLYEMNEREHRALAAQLRKVAGKVVVSGYDGALYRQIFRGWRVAKKESQCDHSDRSVVRTEVLWMNF